LSPYSGSHLTPDMSRTVGLMRRVRATAATIVEPATVPNSVGSGIELYSDAALPASQLPRLVERNQIPIVNPAARSGASLLIALNPTGLSNNSPIVCRK